MKTLPISQVVLTQTLPGRVFAYKGNTLNSSEHTVLVLQLMGTCLDVDISYTVHTCHHERLLDCAKWSGGSAVQNDL